MRNVKAEVEQTDIECDVCHQAKMVIKLGRHGKFLSCARYPECKNAKPLTQDANGEAKTQETITLDQKCPNCGSNLIVRMGRNGRFAACPKYPGCKHAEAIESGVKCPREGCGGDLVERYSSKKKATFYSCNQYPQCRFIVSDKPVPNTKCDRCGNAFLVVDPKAEEPTLKCPSKGCSFHRPA